MKKRTFFYYFITLFFLLICFNAKNIKAEDNVNTYEGELGFSYTSSQTIFRVWSSSASKIKVVVENDANDTKELVKNEENNVWIGYVAGDLLGKNYSYTIEYSDNTTYENVLDPYSKYINADGSRSVIYDSSVDETIEWVEQTNEITILDKNKIIYGINVENFTSHSTWGGNSDNKGKLLALTEENVKYNNISIGLDYIKGLGITYLELSKINDSSIPHIINNELVVGTNSYSGNDELKQVISKYYSNGIGVILSFDITGFSDEFLLNLNKIDNQYYLDNNSNLDMSKAMVKKYIIDLLEYWVEEYKLAGIKFENMGSISFDLINSISLKLKEINPGIVLYGDGSYNSVNDNNAGENNLNKIDIVKMLNGSLNYALFGNLLDKDTKGILDGDYSKEIIETLKFTFLSSVNNGEINYSLVKGVSYNEYWNNTSSYQLVNNMGAKEGLSIYDKLFINNLTSETIIKQKAILAFSTMFMSGGIPYIYSGNEFLISYLDTSKNANNNSICSDGNVFCFYKDEESKLIDWSYLYRNQETVNSFKSLVNFRKSDTSIIQNNSNIISKNVSIYIEEDKDGVIGFTRNYPNSYTGERDKVFVVFNYSNSEVNLENLESKGWSGLYTYNAANRNGETIVLKPISLYAEVKEKQPKINQWISLVLVVVLIGSIYTLNAFLSKRLVEKKGYDIKKVKRKYRPFIKDREKNNGSESQKVEQGNSEINEEKNKDE